MTVAHLQSIEPAKCRGWGRSSCGKTTTVRVLGMGGSYGEYCRKCGERRLKDLEADEGKRFTPPPKVP